MKTLVPDYYKEFHCTAGDCRHSCCVGWEIAVDADTLEKYRRIPGIVSQIDTDEEGNASFRLLEGERCPFLNSGGLCNIIIKHGEDALCQICRDHPRFRNYWSDCTELGLGLVCEEAARIILSRPEKMEWTELEDSAAAVSDESCEAATGISAAASCNTETCPGDKESGNTEIGPDDKESGNTEIGPDDKESGNTETGSGCGEETDILPDDEAWLIDYRERLLAAVTETGPLARLHEYLIIRHIPDALYDGRPEARRSFIEASVGEIADKWNKTDGSFESLCEICRSWSYDVEYDEEELERRISAFE